MELIQGGFESGHSSRDRRAAIANTCFYYPEDRDISKSVRFGKLMAARIH